jgi:hypothetical protein
VPSFDHEGSAVVASNGQLFQWGKKKGEQNALPKTLDSKV